MGRKIGIGELVSRIGDDKIAIQNLDVSATTLDYSAKKGTKITFLTEEPLTPTGTERIGIVLWLPRDKVKEVLNA